MPHVEASRVPARRLLPVLIATVGIVASTTASAHGYGHRHGYGYGSGYGVGVHAYRGGHHRGGGISFSYSGPLYLPQSWSPAPYVPPTQVTRRRLARSLPDMPDLRYTPQAQQDVARQTRDRRECERFAWRSARPDPARGSVRTTRTTHVAPGYRRYPPDPIGPAASGAALGALGGAIAGDAGAGAAIGAVVGAASWLLGAASAPAPATYDVVVQEYVPAPGPDATRLRDALVGCMRERGYAVSDLSRQQG